MAGVPSLVVEKYGQYTSCTLFMDCLLPAQIRPERWHHWEKQREQTARYSGCNNYGAGADTKQRAAWSRQLTKKEVQEATLQRVFSLQNQWVPEGLWYEEKFNITGCSLSVTTLHPPEEPL